MQSQNDKDISYDLQTAVKQQFGLCMRSYSGQQQTIQLAPWLHITVWLLVPACCHVGQTHAANICGGSGWTCGPVDLTQTLVLWLSSGFNPKVTSAICHSVYCQLSHSVPLCYCILSSAASLFASNPFLSSVLWSLIHYIFSSLPPVCCT